MSILACLLLSLAQPSGHPRIDVGLELRAGPGIGVTIVIPGEDDGETLVSLSEGWGGVTGAGGEIAALAASSAGGGPLPVSRTADHLWTIRHAPGERITLAYELTPHEREPLGPGRNDYRNVVRDGLFHAIGNHSLVLPEHLVGPVECSVSWSGFDGWTVASSLGPGSSTREAALHLDELRSCFLIAGEAGKVRLAVRPLDGNEVGLAVIDADWGFSDERMLDLIMQVVAAEREFFGDHTDPWFLVALTPNGGRAGERGFSFGGTGLTNCFALFCNTGLDLSKTGSHVEPVLRLLAHEYFHTWNGRKIRIDAPEGAAYWFSEGFTDFYARRLLRTAGLIDEAAHLASLNESLAEFDTNPMRAVPNERIVEDFWNDREVSAVPYRRGDLVALAIDEAIRVRSGGAENLDDLMRDLYQRSVRGEAPLIPEQFFGLVETKAGPAIGAAVRECVLHGAEPPIPESIESGSLTLSQGTLRRGADGFDVQASRDHGVVTGVVPGSGAHEMGIRDGQTLVSIERLPPVDGPSRLKVVLREGDGERTAVFEAVGPVLSVRKYAPADE